jgi:hypothetical protein
MENADCGLRIENVKKQIEICFKFHNPHSTMKKPRSPVTEAGLFLLWSYRPLYRLLFALPENLSRPGGIASGVGEIFGNISFLAGFNQMVGLFHIVGKTQLALIETVPPGVVRRHHHCAHAGPPALMMPQFVVLDL